MTRRKGYGQFCPVAKAAEIVAERWTPLVLRELICGSHRFTELRRGVPLMSPSLLSKRLDELEDAGIIEKRTSKGKNTPEYHLTQAGVELRPVIEMLGLWGHKWVKKELEDKELDPKLLMWDIERTVDPTSIPSDRRLVVQFELLGAPPKLSRWWLVFDRGEVDLCLKRTGYETDLTVKSELRTFVNVWLGKEDLEGAIRSNTVKLTGARDTVLGFREWFSLSVFARLAKAQALDRSSSNEVAT